MNTFAEHHQASIRFGYRCFDRILLNGVIQPFQQPERVVGFFWTYRQLYLVDRDTLRDIARQYHHWVVNRARHWHVPIQGVPAGRRDEFMDQPFTRARARSGRGDPQSPRTGAHHDGDRQQTGQPLAPGAEVALGRPIQLLHQ